MCPRKNSYDTTATPPVREALGQSEAFIFFQERLSLVARVDRPVLILGERGTGKELAASRLHFLSKRWQEPFIALNCAALPQSLIESELFGHEEGAFTGAVRKRCGRFELAHDGTLFLDEIGNIPMVAQEKILRAVEYGSFERVGGSESVWVNVRIVAATNADLPSLARRGEFKSDLLDRLSFEVLFLPPLRERREDIMLLASHFAARMSFELERPGVMQFTTDAMRHLESYSWPGNVRELKNVVERAVYRSDDDIITAEEIVFDPFDSPYAGTLERRLATPDTSATIPTAESSALRPPPSDTNGGMLLEEAVRDVERTLLRRALGAALYNQRRAAELLGLTYHQFRGLYRKHKDILEANG